MTMKTKNRSLAQKVFTETCRARRWSSSTTDSGRKPRTEPRYGIGRRSSVQWRGNAHGGSGRDEPAEEIDQLLRKLARGTVTPESLREVIEDSL